jgi:hypothetical protein
LPGNYGIHAAPQHLAYAFCTEKVREFSHVTNCGAHFSVIDTSTICMFLFEYILFGFEESELHHEVERKACQYRLGGDQKA